MRTHNTALIQRTFHIDEICVLRSIYCILRILLWLLWVEFKMLTRVPWRLFADGELVTGSSTVDDFIFEAQTPAKDIDSGFAIVDNALVWTDKSSGNQKAAFCLDTSGKVLVNFRGATPKNCNPVVLTKVDCKLSWSIMLDSMKAGQTTFFICFSLESEPKVLIYKFSRFRLFSACCCARP